MKLPIVLFSPFSSCFIPLGLKYVPQFYPIVTDRDARLATSGVVCCRWLPGMETLNPAGDLDVCLS